MLELPGVLVDPLSLDPGVPNPLWLPLRSVPAPLLVEEPGLPMPEELELDPLGEIPLDDPGLDKLPDPVWLSPAEPVAIAATIRSSRSIRTSIAARREASVAPSVPPLRAVPLNPGEVALLPGLPAPVGVPGLDPIDEPGWRVDDDVPNPELWLPWLLAPPGIAPGLEVTPLLDEPEDPVEPGRVGVVELVPLLCPCAYKAPVRERVAIITANFFII